MADTFVSAISSSFQTLSRRGSPHSGRSGLDASPPLSGAPGSAASPDWAESFGWAGSFGPEGAASGAGSSGLSVSSGGAGGMGMGSLVMWMDRAGGSMSPLRVTVWVEA